MLTNLQTIMSTALLYIAYGRDRAFYTVIKQGISRHEAIDSVRRMPD